MRVLETVSFLPIQRELSSYGQIGGVENTGLIRRLCTSIADNPIVFASDGFVKVTGYSRADIIPRNCRFLQGTHTDHTAVRRLKSSIGANKDSVELLLNYRKTGEPFWNLLYVSEFVMALS